MCVFFLTTRATHAKQIRRGMCRKAGWPSERLSERPQLAVDTVLGPDMGTLPLAACQQHSKGPDF